PGARTASLWRSVTIHGQTYDAYTFGTRLQEKSRTGDSIHGIALTEWVNDSAAPRRSAPRRVMALDEKRLRPLEPEEAQDLIAQGRAKKDAVCGVSGQPGGVAFGQWGDEILTFCRPAPLRVLSTRLLAASAARPPNAIHAPAAAAAPAPAPGLAAAAA